jgi:hypothetical protein
VTLHRILFAFLCPLFGPSLTSACTLNIWLWSASQTLLLPGFSSCTWALAKCKSGFQFIPQVLMIWISQAGLLCLGFHLSHDLI